MDWLSDSHTVVAGDIASSHFSRGFNLRSGQWESMIGASMAASRQGNYIVRSVDMVVHLAGGRVKNGVHILGYIVGDPLHTGYVIPWFSGVQSKGHLVGWAGSQPMGCGFLYRILSGGLAATDYIDIAVGYERGC